MDSKNRGGLGDKMKKTYLGSRVEAYLRWKTRKYYGYIYREISVCNAGYPLPALILFSNTPRSPPDEGTKL